MTEATPLASEQITQDADELEALIDKATEYDLADDGRYFSETCNDLTSCRHGETGEYNDQHDGRLVEFLWNHRHHYLSLLRAAALSASSYAQGDVNSNHPLWDAAINTHDATPHLIGCHGRVSDAVTGWQPCSCYRHIRAMIEFAALSASPAPSSQGVSGEVLAVLQRYSVIGLATHEKIAAEIAERLAAPAPSCAPGEVAALIEYATQAAERAEKHGNTEGVWLFAKQWRAIAAALSPQGLDAKEGDEFAGMTAGEAISASADNDTLMRDLSFAYVSVSKRMPGVAAVIDRARNALSATPSQRLDAATVERCAQVAESIYCEGDWLDRDHAANAIAAAIRALATEPHQHGGKGA